MYGLIFFNDVSCKIFAGEFAICQSPFFHRLSQEVKGINVNFSKRFPSLKQLSSVYSVAVVIIYGWSIIRFFWRLPSFIYYSTVGEIGVIFSYSITVNLLESLLVVSVPVVLSLILRSKWFFERFVARGVLLVLLGLGYMMYIGSHNNINEPFPYTLFRWAPLALLLILVLVFFMDRIKFLTRILEIVSDRLEVFLLISIPVSVISFMVVLIRNVF